jgi:hypothetical protein
MSSNPVTETKIELVTEAIEALVLASVISASPEPRFMAQRQANYQNVLDAREVLKGCLREFLQPSLRVVQSQRHSRAGDLETTLTRTVAEASNLA